MSRRDKWFYRLQFRRCILAHMSASPIRSTSYDIDATVDRLIVASDLHSHQPALAAFEELRCDLPGTNRLLYNGDVFSGGARPAEAATWVMEHAQELATLGNHDETMLEGGDPTAPPFTEAGAHSRLTDEQLDYFRGLAHRLIISWRTKRIVLMHGHVTSAGEPSSWRVTPDEQIADFAESDVDLVILSHTHSPYLRTRDAVTYANTGSLSSTILGVEQSGRVCGHRPGSKPASDGDLRSSLLSITEASGVLEAELIRFDYDREAALEDLERAGATDMERRRRWLTEGIVVLSE